MEFLARMMQIHYGKQVILLLDEYDVPIAKASEEWLLQRDVGSDESNARFISER